MNNRHTITDVAKALGVTPRTIMRWEKSGKIRKPKRDWRGWRFYLKEDLEDIKKFFEAAYDYEEYERSALKSAKDVFATVIIILLSGIALSSITPSVYANSNNFAKTSGIKETNNSVDIVLNELPAVEAVSIPVAEPQEYTLGPNDVITIEVRRHPEFSGRYIINSEGKIQYRYLGDICVDGMTKLELKEYVTKLLSEYLIDPDVDVQIVEYLSKVFYVVGDVNRPGKFYMRGNNITVREALVQAGLPNHAAAMRRCRIITPNERGKDNYREVNVYSLLYEGDLRQNFIMRPGEVLYIPSTVIAKIIRIISPVTDAVSQAAGAAARGAGIAAGAL